MSIRSKMARVFAGEGAEKSEILEEFWNKATKKWFSSSPKRYSKITKRNIKRFLTPKEYRKFKKADKAFDKYYQKGGFQKIENIVIEYVPKEKLKKVI
jgi:hypothetical protein